MLEYDKYLNKARTACLSAMEAIKAVLDAIDLDGTLTDLTIGNE
jgi:hypothetical protein